MDFPLFWSAGGDIINTTDWKARDAMLRQLLSERMAQFGAERVIGSYLSASAHVGTTPLRIMLLVGAECSKTTLFTIGILDWI